MNRQQWLTVWGFDHRQSSLLVRALPNWAVTVTSKVPPAIFPVRLRPAF